MALVIDTCVLLDLRLVTLSTAPCQQDAFRPIHRPGCSSVRSRLLNWPPPFEVTQKPRVSGWNLWALQPLSHGLTLTHCWPMKYGMHISCASDLA